MRWFKHDSNANVDAKLRKLRAKFGMEGYGLYWYCLELIAGTVERNKLTFQLEHDAELISIDTGIHHERIEEMMQYMVNLGLFEEDRGIITCLKMASRSDEYTQKLIKSENKLKTVSRQTPDSVQTNSRQCLKNPALIEQNRTEQNRKTRGRASRFTPPTIEQVSEYVKAKGYSVDPERFINHYESNGWMVGKNKMRSWPHAVANWEKTQRSSGGWADDEGSKPYGYGAI